MFKASQHSKDVVKTLVPPLRDLYWFLLNYIDLKALYGLRDEKLQNELYDKKASKLKYPESRHNKSLILEKRKDPKFKKYSDAVDLLVFVDGKPRDDKDSHKYYIMMWGIARAWAELHGVTLRWGGNWDNDQVILDDQDFDDLMHIEVVDYPLDYGMQKI